MHRSQLALALLAPVLCTGCLFGGSDETNTSEEEVIETPTLPERLSTRPSALMGIFFSGFISEYNYLNAVSANNGISTTIDILTGQTTAQTDETFILLQELGNILGVNFLDILNRSDNRAVALDQYKDSLQGITDLSKRKITELEQMVDQLEDQRRDERRTAGDIDREVKRAIRDEDFVTAGSKQELLTKAEEKLSETESNLKQTEGILNNFEKAVEKAEEKLTLIESNREVFISGLTVKDVPGIEEYGILGK